MRTQEERNAAVTALQENKKHVRRLSMFGNDNHANIEAMIRTIKNDYKNDSDIYSAFENPEIEDDENDELSGGFSALEYLKGESELEDILYPA